MGGTKLSTLALTAGIALLAPRAHADIVRLKVSADTFGQGWMFLDQDGQCKVVTAGHVIRGVDGKLRQPLIYDARGREWTTGAPTLNSTNPDVAVVPVPAANNPNLCGEGRLSAVGVARRVANLTGGLIRTTGESEIRDVPVSRRAAEVDANAGGLFAVRPTTPGDVVTKGWSGSVVMDAEGPLGIVYEVDPEANEAYAVRADVIRTLMAAAPAMRLPPLPSGPQGGVIAVLAGTTSDPAVGPDQLTSGTGTFWQVTPAKRTVVFSMRFAAPTKIKQVTLGTSFAGVNRIEALDVSTQADAEQTDWTWANYCKVPGGAGLTADCHFLSRTVTTIRVLVKTASDAPIELGGLVVE